MTTMTDAHRCPGCSGEGVLSDDPQVLRCESCGGVFTVETITLEQAMKFVGLHLTMLDKAGPDGQFYFDLLIYRARPTPDRYHGWADVKTKRVVQLG